MMVRNMKFMMVMVMNMMMQMMRSILGMTWGRVSSPFPSPSCTSSLPQEFA